MYTDHTKYYMGSCLAGHLLGQKIPLKCTQFTFWGSPWLLVQRTPFEDLPTPPFGEVCHSFTSRGWIDNRPLVLMRPQLLCGKVAARDETSIVRRVQPYLQLPIWQNCPLWNIYSPRHTANWNSYGSLEPINCFKSYLTLLSRAKGYFGGPQTNLQ